MHDTRPAHLHATGCGDIGPIDYNLVWCHRAKQWKQNKKDGHWQGRRTGNREGTGHRNHLGPIIHAMREEGQLGWAVDAQICLAKETSMVLRSWEATHRCGNNEQCEDQLHLCLCVFDLTGCSPQRIRMPSCPTRKKTCSMTGDRLRRSPPTVTAPPTQQEPTNSPLYLWDEVPSLFKQGLMHEHMDRIRDQPRMIVRWEFSNFQRPPVAGHDEPHPVCPDVVAMHIRR